MCQLLARVGRRTQRRKSIRKPLLPLCVSVEDGVRDKNKALGEREVRTNDKPSASRKECELGRFFRQRIKVFAVDMCVDTGLLRLHGPCTRPWPASQTALAWVLSISLEPL